MTGIDHHVAFLRQLPRSRSVEEPALRYPLSVSETVALGRDPRCQIALDPILYRAVSRRHAEVGPVLGFASSGGTQFWQVCDLDSANGTYVNGQRLQGCQVLRMGDCIMLGQNGPEFVFEYNLPNREPSPLQSPAPTGVNLPPFPPQPSLRTTVRSATPAPSRRRELDSVSLTQLFPIFSTGRELARKAYLVPGGITVAFVVLLFLAVGQPIAFNLLLAGYLAGAAYYFIYQLCGKHKPWWLLASMAVMTILLLLSPVLELLIFVFRSLLPGAIPTEGENVSFPVLLVRMFFGAGLMEELLKALPILVAYLLGKCFKSPWREQLGIWEPLDGILLGAASAVGFTLLETLGQYVPEIYNSTVSAGESAAQLASLQLLIPRVLGSVAGHLAYSGYLGYFIGLSVLRPRKRWLTLGVGYLTASGLHALWNATGVINPAILAFVGMLSYAFLAAAILKARELSPTRSQNFATRFYK